MRTATETEWRDAAARHRDRAEGFTAGRRARTARGETHPVDDFLFTYYGYRAAVLERWHPGAGVVLEGATERREWRFYAGDDATAWVDADAFLARHGAHANAIDILLRRTTERPARFGCFGLHEWAMVYRQPDRRHEVPLRLGQRGTDEVVEAERIQCTHFDAFRFFTPDAVPLNAAPLTRDGQPLTEQSGCLHAGMDLYKWAVKLGPLVPGEVLLDCFALAREIRDLDMRASPYDLAEWGYSPVAIETPAGKAEYVAAQRGFAARADALRERVRGAYAAARGLETPPAAAPRPA